MMQQYAVEQPAALGMDAYAVLDKQAEELPQVALDSAGRVRHPMLRDRLERRAFLALASRQPDVARGYVQGFLNRPWIGDVGFFGAVALAAQLPPDVAERLLIAAAQRDPGIALRQPALYNSAPGVLDAAMLAARDEAVLLASGESSMAQGLLAAMRASANEPVRLLADIARMEGLDDPARARLAALAPSIAAGRLTLKDASITIADAGRYFRALVDARLAASGHEAGYLDRTLETFALGLCRAYQSEPAQASELKAFPARDLVLLLAFAAPDENDRFFPLIFDRLLKPRFKPADVTDLRLHDLVNKALSYHRFSALAATAGPELYTRLFSRIAPDALAEAITAADVLENTRNKERLKQIAGIVKRDFATNKPVYGLLAARLVTKYPDAALRPLGQPYAAYLRGSDSLSAASLFDSQNRCVQRYIFYNDGDGVDSFESFRRRYAGDAAWRIENHGDYVRISSRSPRGRRIEIFANVPLDVTRAPNLGRVAEAEGRQDSVTRALRAAGLTPRVVVHRGHVYFLNHSVRLLNADVRFVFIGACRGLAAAIPVLEASPEAQVVATRGNGTLRVNDPLLKSINQQLLSGAKAIAWPAFWAAQAARLGDEKSFADYIPPHRNPASTFLRAYYHSL